MHTLRTLATSIDRMNGRIGVVLRWLVLLMVLVGAYNALARYATKFAGVSLSSNAMFDLTWQLFSVVFLMGAAYALDRDAHVRVDIVYAKLSAKGRAWIDLLGTVLFLLPFCALMLWVSWSPIQNSWRVREGSPNPGGLLVYPIKTVVIFCFALLILQGFSQIIKQIAILRGELPPEGVKSMPVEPDARHGEGV